VDRAPVVGGGPVFWEVRRSVSSSAESLSPISEAPQNHEEVLEAGRAAGQRNRALLADIVRRSPARTLSANPSPLTRDHRSTWPDIVAL
jgi:hypothetical protein